MLCIDSVPSRAYQTEKVAANASAKQIVDTTRLTPRLSVRLSVISVPTTLIKTTAVKYSAGM